MHHRQGTGFTPGPPPLPVIHSLLAPGALAQVFEAAYGLEQMRCRLIQASIRDTYGVASAPGPFVLSLYRHGRHAPRPSPPRRW